MASTGKAMLWGCLALIGVPFLAVCFLLVRSGRITTSPVHIFGDGDAAGALIYVDGRFVKELGPTTERGRTNAILALPRGDHTVSVRKTGYVTFTEAIHLTNEGYVVVDLEPADAPTGKRPQPPEAKPDDQVPAKPRAGE